MVSGESPIGASDYDSLRLDVPNWLESHLVVEPKGGGLVPFRLNVVQNKVLSVINYLRSLDRPVRLIILKARQHGITTFGLGYFYYRANCLAQHHGMMAAHKLDAAISLFNKVDCFQAHNPERLETRVERKRELSFSHPHGSSIWVDTAGDADLGRSGTIQDFHGSEVAFWDNARSSMASVMQCVPGLPDTTVILESTANGLGGEFYRRWCASCRLYRDDSMHLPGGRFGDSEFVALFLPWHISPEYRTALPADGSFKMTDEEVELRDSLHLDDEQIYWRRKAIKDLCGGDLDLFHQEYPSTDEEAFLVSGRPVFDVKALSILSNRSRPAGMGSGSFDATGRFVESAGPAGKDSWVEIDVPPLSDGFYVMGADTSEGLAPEDSNDPDYHSATVLNCSDSRLRMVAKISGRFDPDLYGEQLDALGRYYHNALLGLEVNNTSGGSVRSTLKRLDYPNLYWRERYDELTDKMTRKIGWYTDKMTRGLLILDLIRFVRERGLSIYSESTLAQLKTFVYDRSGKAQAAAGEHDDDVISLGIALQMAIYSVQYGLVSPLGVDRTFSGSMMRYNKSNVDSEVESGYDFDDSPSTSTACLIGGCEPDPQDDYDDLVNLDL